MTTLDICLLSGMVVGLILGVVGAIVAPKFTAELMRHTGRNWRI